MKEFTFRLQIHYLNNENPYKYWVDETSIIRWYKVISDSDKEIIAYSLYAVHPITEELSLVKHYSPNLDSLTKEEFNHIIFINRILK